MKILRWCSEKINKRRVIFVGIFVVLIGFVTLLSNNQTYAKDNGAELSWVSQYPELFSANPVKAIPLSYCSHSLSLEDVSGELNKLELCVSGGRSMSFGFDTGAQYKAYVKFANDLKMHRVYGTCVQYDSCLYLPGIDTLITKRNIVNGYVRSLAIYKNYSKRLSSFINPANMALEYIFDESNPDYIFKNSSGYAWPIGGIGISDNEKWLVIEFRQRGIGLLNLETLEMKRISTMSFSYGTGFDPTSELAIANNGKSIAIMGLNSGATIFENNDNCGDLATDTNMSGVLPIIKPCDSQPIKHGAFINRFLYATFPRFTDDGYGLDFYAESYNNDKIAVSLRAVGSNTEKLEYLALGDSYSSGEGEYSDQYYLDGTNEEREKCHVSSRSYPFLIADFSDLDLNLVKSVACSGAETKDIVGNDVDYWGQNNRLGKQGLDLTRENKVSFQIESKKSFIQGRIHQNVFVDEYKPKIITIGIGGNDVGMVSKLQTCIGPGTCNWASDQKMREQFALEIKSMFNTLTSTYKEIHNSSPASKIFAVGYPRPADGAGTCGPLTGFILDNEERTFMTEAVLYLNQVVKAAAKKAGVGFLDIQEAYGNHVMCGSETPSGINSIAIGDDIGFSGESSWIKFIGNESFHPNPYGHLLAATYIFNSIGDISKYDYCADKSAICSDNISAPEPSEYWIGESYDNYPSLALSDFLSSGSNQNNQLQKKIILPSFSFIPNSQVKIVINSTPTELGIFNAGDDGSLLIDLDLPSDLEEGFHSIFIHGRSYSGDQIDLYQIIKYQKKLSDYSQEKNSEQIISSIDGLSNNIKEDLEKTVLNIDTDKYKDQVVEDNIVSSSQIEADSFVSSSVIIDNPEVLGVASENKNKNIYSAIDQEKTNINIDIITLTIFISSVFVVVIVILVLVKKYSKHLH